MITLHQPSLGLNAATGHHVFVRMWNTGNVPSAKTPEEIAEWIRIVAQSAPGGQLRNCVFCCHGSPGYIGLGRGIRRADLHHFGRLVVNGRPLVYKFWFRCCSVARIPTPASGTPSGNVFCQEFARTTRAYVVASTETQWERPRTLPFGQLDTFEGLVLSYGPTGNVSWSQRYMSGRLGALLH